ncbi:MFS transporter [Trinickia sp. NRRL B-1857]
MLGSALGYAMDGFDLLILGFMLPAIRAALHLSPEQAGALVTWTLVGAVVGGIGFGLLSDRFGRVRVLTWTIAVFALFTGLCAVARGFSDLLFYRTMAGVGLGGEFGIGMALAAEACPPRERARFSSYVALGWQAGVLGAALLTPLLLPFLGWRGMFALGLAPALVAFVMRRTLSEPETFVRRTPERIGFAERIKALFGDAHSIKSSAALFVLCSIQNFGYYGIMIWMPTFLCAKLGFSLTRSGMWTAVTVLGMMAGVWCFGQLADRVGRKPTFVLYQIGAAVTVVLYARLTQPASMLWAGAVMGAFVNGMVGGYGALLSELYPTRARATAQNVLWNAGRAVGGLGPLVVGAIASRYSYPVAISTLAALYVLDIAATIFLVSERKGHALD